MGLKLKKAKKPVVTRGPVTNRRRPLTPDGLATLLPGDRKRLCVDPGLAGTGYALWNWEDWHTTPPLARPCSVGVLRHANGSLSDRLQRYYDDIVQLVTEHRVGVVIVEWPEFQRGAIAQAANRAGDLFKLCGCATVAMAAAWACDAHASAVPVSEWKGNMSKEAVNRHIERFLDGAQFENHASDAVGIGLYIMGAWK